ncbi:MAG: hypothetical protein DIZ80_17475, partial [endosymbiont of Galathealinum brachiosum]
FIYDNNSDAGLGFVNYAGWLSSSVFVNSTPVIGGIPDAVVNVGDSYLFTPTATDADVNDVLTFSITGAPTWSIFDETTGELSGIPTIADAGTTTNIVITVTDNDTTPASSSLTAFSIKVNRIPVANDDVFTMNVDSVLNEFLSASDSDADALTYSVMSNAINGAASIDLTSGVMTYTPNTGFTGEDSFTYSVNDGYADSNTATVTVIIEAVANNVFKGSNLTVLNADGTNANGGANDVAVSWNGVTTTNVADTNFSNMTVSSDTPFYGMSWSIHHVRIFGPGTYNFDTSCSVAELEAGVTTCSGGPMLTMTVGAGQVGAHMLFDWNGSLNTDVVNVYDVNSVFTTNSAGSLWMEGNYGPYPWSGSPVAETIWRLASTDNDGDGIAGVPMVDGLLIGSSINFNLNIVEADSNFTMLDDLGDSASGTNDVVAQWNGLTTTVMTSTDFNNLIISSETAYFFNNWTVHHARMFGPGTYSFDTSCTVAQIETGVTSCSGGPMLSMTVAQGQVGAHMLFDWGDSYNVDVVNVYDINATFTTNAPATLWAGGNYGPYPWSGVPDVETEWRLVSTDNDGDGIAGVKMVEGGLTGWNINFNLFANAGVSFFDTDNDGIADNEDNCIEVSNPNQLDTDRDGYGNICDGDLNNDGRVNSLDLGLFKSAFFTFGNLPADFNGDQIVNSLDLGIFKRLFFTRPGPSGLVE